MMSRDRIYARLRSLFHSIHVLLDRRSFLARPKVCLPVPWYLIGQTKLGEIANLEIVYIF
jgi:hypothetical protein